MLNPPFEVAVLNLRLGMELHDKCPIGRQSSLLFVHHVTLIRQRQIMD